MFNELSLLDLPLHRLPVGEEVVHAVLLARSGFARGVADAEPEFVRELFQHLLEQGALAGTGGAEQDERTRICAHHIAVEY